MTHTHFFLDSLRDLRSLLTYWQQHLGGRSQARYGSLHRCCEMTCVARPVPFPPKLISVWFDVAAKDLTDRSCNISETRRPGETLAKAVHDSWHATRPKTIHNLSLLTAISTHLYSHGRGRTHACPDISRQRKNKRTDGKRRYIMNTSGLGERKADLLHHTVPCLSTGCHCAIKISLALLSQKPAVCSSLSVIGELAPAPWKPSLRVIKIPLKIWDAYQIIRTTLLPPCVNGEWIWGWGRYLYLFKCSLKSRPWNTRLGKWSTLYTSAAECWLP